MKKTYCSLFLFLINFFVFSQEVPQNPLFENDNEKNNIGENVLLYEINLDEVKIPIEIVYNHSGFKANQAPGIVGLGWEFNDIGKIKRILKHIPDDFQVLNDPTKGGWFFNDNSSLATTGTNNPSYTYSKGILNLVDQTPDLFDFSTINGSRALFTFNKVFSGGSFVFSPFFLDSDENYTITTYFNKFNYGVNNYSDTVFEVNEENGLKYSFIGGPTNKTITRNGGYNNKDIKDYYLNKISSSHSSDEVTINYLERLYEEKNYSESGYKNIANAYAVKTSSDYTFQGENELVVKEILTPKENIYFNYSYMNYPNDQAYGQYSIPILNEIIVKNQNGEHITGFVFEYNLTINNRPLLTAIYKTKKDFDNDPANMIKIKSFEYFDFYDLEFKLFYTSPSFMFREIDAFGYYNGANNATLMPVDYKNCSGKPIYSGANRVPNIDAAKSGVLKKVTNNLGGIKEYDYQLNADGNYYGGGLKISKITDTPVIGTPIETAFEYKDYKGFGIRLNNPSLDMVGPYITNNASVSSNVNSELYDFDQEAGNQNIYQTSGGFFGTFTITKYIEDAYDPLNGNTKRYLTVDNYFRSNYRTATRTSMLSQKITSIKTVYTDIIDDVYGGFYTTSGKINELVNNYGLYDSSSLPVNKISLSSLQSCSGSELYGRITIQSIPIYKKEQPLQSSEYLEYNNDSQEVTSTKQEFTYFGQTNPSYTFNSLRPKEIVTYKNNFPVTKKKFKYLIEFITPTAGLGYLTAFSTQNKTLLTEESNWVYNNASWILNDAMFYEYNADGKLNQTSSSFKQSNGSLFNESNFNPYFSSGIVTNVPLHNKTSYSYDLSGKIELIVDLEKKQFKKFFRAKDFNSGLINSTLEGDSQINVFTLFRNSFESDSGADFIDVTNAYTGKRVFNGASISIGSFPNKSVVSYWSYQNGSWIFNTFEHSGGTLVITKPVGADYIDEVSVRPRNTILTGKTYNKYYEATHFIEDKGFVTKNIFDDYGRLIKQVDQDGNIINERSYNFIQE